MAKRTDDHLEVLLFMILGTLGEDARQPIRD